MKKLVFIVGAILLSWVIHGLPMYGTARTEGTSVWIRWTNVPSAVVVQHSTNLTDWQDVLIVSQVGGNGLDTFEYMAPSASSLAYRLRVIAPIMPPSSAPPFLWP